MADLTKKAILNSFMKLLAAKHFDNITVKDIAEDCGVTRRTFYYHYKDLYDLVESLFLLETEAILADYNPDSWEESLIAASKFILDNKPAIYHLYNSVHRTELENYIDKIATSVMTAFIDDLCDGHSIEKMDKLLICDFYKYAIVGIAIKWIDGGMKEDAEEAINRLGKLFYGNIKRSIRNCLIS